MEEHDSSPPLTDAQEIRALRRRVTALEASIGDPADPIARTPATGLVGAVVAIQATLDQLVDEVRATGAARKSREDFLSRVAWGLGLPLIGAALIGAGALAWRWFASLHH